MLRQLTSEEQAYAAKNAWTAFAKRSFATSREKKRGKKPFSAGPPPQTALRARALALQKASLLPQSAQKLSQVSFDNRGNRVLIEP